MHCRHPSCSLGNMKFPVYYPVRMCRNLPIITTVEESGGQEHETCNQNQPIDGRHDDDKAGTVDVGDGSPMKTESSSG